MTKYLVTTELKTTWWIKFLRFIRLKAKRNEFQLVLADTYFKKGDILEMADRSKLLILRKCT